MNISDGNQEERKKFCFPSILVLLLVYFDSLSLAQIDYGDFEEKEEEESLTGHLLGVPMSKMIKLYYSLAKDIVVRDEIFLYKV